MRAGRSLIATRVTVEGVWKIDAFAPSSIGSLRMRADRGFASSDPIHPHEDDQTYEKQKTAAPQRAKSEIDARSISEAHRSFRPRR